jgi:hypothetical protein
MALTGLPDFQHTVRGSGFEAYPPFGGVGPYLVAADSLEIAADDEGRPDFLLEFIRGENPFLPPEPRGALSFRLCAGYPLEAALAQVRAVDPGAALKPAAFTSGFLRLQPTFFAEDLGDTGEIAGEFLRPAPLLWNSLGTARYALDLSQAGALLLERALQGDILLVDALVELEMAGVAPRLPLQVIFDPAELLAALNALADPPGAGLPVSRAALLTFFLQEITNLPLQVAGELDESQRAAFSEAMVDRVRERFGSFVPAPEGSRGPHLALLSPEDTGQGIFRWDLAAPLQARRPFTLELHPIEAAQAVVRAQGLEAVVRRTVVPPLETGVLPVSILTNLPEQLTGVLSLGVTVQAPAWPPFRPQASVETVELLPPANAAEIRLRFSPAEEPAYSYQTFAVVRGPGGVQVLKGNETTHSGSRLDLSVEDFPLDFVPLSAAQELLQVASIHGACRYLEGEVPVEIPFTLGEDRPLVTLALPKGTAGATLDITALARVRSQALSLGPFPAGGQRLGLYSFPGYGPHTIPVQCLFDEATALFAVDLLAEDAPETPEAVSVLAFTPAEPERAWRWFATDPFHAGYRYRPHGDGGDAGTEWSQVCSPFTPLVIDLRQKERIEDDPA